MGGNYIPRLGGKQIADAQRREREHLDADREWQEARSLAYQQENAEHRARIEAVLANPLYVQHPREWYVFQLEHLRSEAHRRLTPNMIKILGRIERSLASGKTVFGAEWKPEKQGAKFRAAAPDWMLDPSKLPMKPPTKRNA